jgi:hypothetical protein
MFLVVGDVSFDSEMSVVTLSFLRFVGPTRFFRGTHRSRICMRL